jgi:hypothetical protein
MSNQQSICHPVGYSGSFGSLALPTLSRWRAFGPQSRPCGRTRPRLRNRGINYLGVRGFAFCRFGRFYVTATSLDYFRGNRETHGPVRVQTVIEQDKSLAAKILTPLFCRGQTQVF